MTEKFEKELEKFFEWANKNSMIVKNRETDETIEWKKDMIKFIEPGRNKMETFLKIVMENNNIYDNNNNIVDDNKILVVKYKLEKPKKSYNKKKNEKEEVVKVNETIEKKVRKPRESKKKIETEVEILINGVKELTTKEQITTNEDSIEKKIEFVNLDYKINLEDILCN